MNHPRLRLSGVSKSFSGVPAVQDVNFSIETGETLGLVGENGAGKSTLLNILCGILRPDSGEYMLGEEPRRFRSVAEAEAAGVFRVHQEQALIAAHRVCQNMYLGQEVPFTTFGVLNLRSMARSAQRILDEAGIKIAPHRPTVELSFGERQLIEIARVLAKVELTQAKNPLILLDEPTASLSGEELQTFYRIVDRLKTVAKASIVFISHRLDEVIELSDRILVMKDGRPVRDDLRKPTETQLHRLMVGRERIEDFYATGRQNVSPGEGILQLDSLTSSRFKDIALNIRAGEIVGIGGLAQSGKHELGRAIFGLVPSEGNILLNGTEMQGMEPSRRVQLGAGYVPLDRHQEGVMLNRGVSDNIALASLPELTPKGIANLVGIATFGRSQIEKFRIKTASASSPIWGLSGGNQQKAVLARWLAKSPRLFVVDNPTRGVDAGAKEEIYGFLRDFTAQGGAVLLISDDLVELIEMSSRVAFMANGELSPFTEAPPGAKPGEHDLIHMMF